MTAYPTKLCLNIRVCLHHNSELSTPSEVIVTATAQLLLRMLLLHCFLGWKVLCNERGQVRRYMWLQNPPHSRHTCALIPVRFHKLKVDVKFHPLDLNWTGSRYLNPVFWNGVILKWQPVMVTSHRQSLERQCDIRLLWMSNVSFGESIGQGPERQEMMRFNYGESIARGQSANN